MNNPTTAAEYVRQEATKDLGAVMEVLDRIQEQLKGVNLDNIGEEALVSAVAGVKYLTESSSRQELVAIILNAVSNPREKE